ncbi:MAG: ornithine carbamoyltransferase [Leptospiraceae bacterium]|nr:ornithine carbamoyltransferase [Leptospiraceae bacterium]
MQTRHLLHLNDWAAADIAEILGMASRLKQNRFAYTATMQHKTMVMLFQKTSTRTRVSFETALTELGGHAIYLNWANSNFDLTRIEYEVGYLARNVSMIMARLKRHEDVLRMGVAADVPVINGCCNRFHPCQALADALTIQESRGQMQGARVCYVGVLNNVSNSLMAIAHAFDMHLTLVCPIVPDGVVDPVAKERLLQKGLLTETTRIKAAVREADFVYTDTWIDMEFFNNPAYEEMKSERIRQMLPYQLNAETLGGLDCKIMHDMPIHPGYEIDADLVYDPRSVIFQQAENRLHAQKAVILYLAGYRLADL